MKLPVIAGLSALATTLFIGGFVVAQNTAGVQTLRGADIEATLPTDDIHRPMEGRKLRNYRQQPPIIPHSTDQYQIDLRTNQCLACHDWTKAGERGAPTLSMTHYLDRDGVQMDTVAGTRWFCNQCHVPQVNAPELVGNTFTPSNSLK
ncbi:MAG: ferredoxin [Alphaproteobacteria bacterium HGW-Alphaproteobacteria-1]|jgi:cytochrome c-type protein NapB|nr:MAG: ferredoxin [Alphaproteobacteria bacterium HGW-Alphaproteobacteria-1]